MIGNSWVTKELVASQEEIALIILDLVNNIF
jgi:hypothetical protein